MKEELKILGGVGMDADVISITSDWSARDVREKKKKTVDEDIEEKWTKNATLWSTQIEAFRSTARASKKGPSSYVAEVAAYPS